MEKTRTKCVNFADGGKEYEFRIENNRVFHRIDGNESGVFGKGYWSFSEVYPEGKKFAFGETGIELRMIQANNNRIFAHGTKTEGGQKTNKFFWAQLVNEFPDEPGIDNGIPGLYVRKRLGPIGDDTSDISPRWKDVWKKADGAYSNYPFWLLFNRNDFLLRRVAPLFRMLIADFLLEDIEKNPLFHFSDLEKEFLSKMHEYHPADFWFVHPIADLDEAITDDLLAPIFYKDCIPVIVESGTWYEINPVPPAPDAVLASVIKSLPKNIADFIGKHSDKKSNTLSDALAPALSSLDGFMSKALGKSEPDEHEWLTLDDKEIVDIGVANTHRFDHYKRSCGGEVQGFIYPYEVEEAAMFSIESNFEQMERNILRNIFPRYLGEDRYDAFIDALKDVLYNIPNFETLDGNGFSDGTCNFFVLYKEKDKEECRVAWCDEQEYYSEHWRDLTPEDRSFKGLGSMLAVFEVIEKYHWIPIRYVSEFCTEHKDRIGQFFQSKDPRESLRALLTIMKETKECKDLVPLLDTILFEIENDKVDFLKIVLTVLSDPPFFLAALCDSMIKLLKKESDFKEEIEKWERRIAGTFSVLFMDDFEKDFIATIPKLDSESRLAVSRYPVVATGKDGLHSISYMWGTTDFGWMKRSYPGGERGRDFKPETTILREDMTIVMEGTRDGLAGYWYAKYIPASVQARNFIENPYSKCNDAKTTGAFDNWRFATKECYEAKDKYFYFGIYENRSVGRKYYGVKGSDERCLKFDIGITGSSEYDPGSYKIKEHPITNATLEELKSFLRAKPDSEWLLSKYDIDGCIPINPVYAMFGPHLLPDDPEVHKNLARFFSRYIDALSIRLSPDLRTATIGHPRNDDIRSHIVMVDNRKERKKGTAYTWGDESPLYEELNKECTWYNSGFLHQLKISFKGLSRSFLQPAIEKVSISRNGDRVSLSILPVPNTSRARITSISIGALDNGNGIILHEGELDISSNLVSITVPVSAPARLLARCFTKDADATQGTSVWFTDDLGHKSTPDSIVFENP